MWPWVVVLAIAVLTRRPEPRHGLWARRSVLVALAALTLSYLHWRVTASLNGATAVSTALSWLLLTAEAWLLLTGLVPLVLSWRRFEDGGAAADRAAARWSEGSWRPQVDVLVPTCGEPLAVLARCLVGCSGLSYPHTTVWVLDDSNRTEVRELAARHGCRYLNRRERCHAKAGNLNAGLAVCSGELVAVFDADFVPQRHFLDRTIGLLEEPKVGLVQTPQVFFNADPLMRNLAMERWMLPDEDNFYRWIEPVRSAWGAVVCAGTAFVAKRQALEQVGGFVEGALSEDFVTGIALLGSGWQVRYVGSPLSAGLAAETLLDFVRQRQRWAAGTLQSLRLPQGPLRQPGLGVGQRFALLEGCLHWTSTLPRLLVLLMPLSYGLAGVVPITMTAEALQHRLLPMWLALLISVGWLNRRSRHALLNELPNWVLTVPLATTVLASLVGRFGGFRITPKQQPRSRGGASVLLVAPLLVLLALQLLNLVRLAGSLTNAQPGLRLGLLWAGVTVLGLLVALRACWDRADPDPVPWLAAPVMATFRRNDGSIGRIPVEAISERGADLLLTPRDRAALPVPLTLELRSSSDQPVATLRAEIGDAQAYASTGRAKASGLVRLSLRWSPGQHHPIEDLQRWLFCRPGCWQQRQASNEWRALLALIRHLWRWPRPLVAGQRSLVQQTGSAGSPEHPNAAKSA